VDIAILLGGLDGLGNLLPGVESRLRSTTRPRLSRLRQDIAMSPLSPSNEDLGVGCTLSTQCIFHLQEERRYEFAGDQAL
jgi:hypothetical protein